MIFNGKKIIVFIFSFFLVGNNLKAIDISKMTNREKIGQMLMIAFRKWQSKGDSQTQNVTELNNEIGSIIKEYKIGNVILFGENIPNELDQKEAKAKVQKLVLDFKKLSGNIPMIVAIDQEGGRVQRIKFNGEYKANGDIETKEEALEKGKAIGNELNELGISCNLAPVADINEMEYSTTGNRSFGSDPKFVSDCCAVFYQGLKENSIWGTAKHFPGGMGSTKWDSHKDQVVIEKTLDELRLSELIPFKRLIQEDIEMIMTEHVIFSKIDDKPVTLSKKISTDLLRTELGYKGIVITDALNMKGITKYCNSEFEVCKLAIEAGADICLMPILLDGSEESSKRLDKLYSYLEHEIEVNEEFKKRVDESVNRIVEAKNKLSV